jgi:hypothetical protein
VGVQIRGPGVFFQSPLEILKSLVGLAPLLVHLAHEEKIISLRLRPRGQIVRTGGPLRPPDGTGGGAGSGRPKNEEEIKKNPSVEGHGRVLEVLKIRPDAIFIVLSNWGVVKSGLLG